MYRHEFLDICAAMITGLTVHQAVGRADAAGGDAPRAGRLDATYLDKGLTGMARAKGWFESHWGAGVLAGYYLCNENNLGPETVEAIKSQLDAVIALRDEQFTPLPEQPADASLVERIPEALVPAMRDGVRAHGHAVIFASLSTRALRDAPHMAQPKLVDSLCGLSRQVAKKAPKKPANVQPYADTQAMIDATFVSLARFEPLLGRPSVRRPNFTHMITHTEALMNLEMMGYRDLAVAGHVGHRAHIDEPVPAFDDAANPRDAKPVTWTDIQHKEFWQDPAQRQRWNHAWSEANNPNGYWVAFGHLFKVLYSFHRLIRHVDDPAVTRLCGTILLERYFNPDVQGG
ncbi:MAG: hypothetical protein GC159_18810 [Phycisphaera sp.]|nr:hypothetical protein [Phycisphaera sp.]